MQFLENTISYRAMLKTKAKIEKMIAGIVESESFDLVDIEFKEGKKTSIEVFIWKPGGISVSDCRKVSREISDAMDIADLMPGKYYLVVSSPGLDRPLKTIRDFQRSVGEDVKMTLKSGKIRKGEILSTKNIEGKDYVVIDDSGNISEIEILNIKKGKIQIMP